MGFDLSTRRLSNTGDLNIIDPKTGEETNWIITFAGPGHEKTIKQQNRMINTGMKRARTKGGVQSYTAEEVREQGVDFIVERIIGWVGLVDSGKDIAFDEDIAKKLLSDPELSWAKRQCDEYLADDASFIKRSAKT